MKLYKQTRLKAAVVTAAFALLAAFLGIVKAQPGTEAGEPQASPTPDYDRIFAPDRSATPSTPAAQPAPHTRTRAS
jgi:hypothetical protein